MMQSFPATEVHGYLYTQATVVQQLSGVALRAMINNTTNVHFIRRT